MTGVLAALVPVFLLIGTGYALRRLDFPGDAFWRPAERLTYYLLFPALLVRNLAGAGFGDLPAARLALALLAGLAGTALLALLLGRLLRLEGAELGALFQGSIRFNTYLGLAAAASLFGPPGLTLAAVAVAALIPPINVLCVAVLARAGAPTQWGRVAAAVARNPLILACALGLALNGAGLHLPDVLAETLAILGRGALPLGLLAVGAGLELRGHGEHWGALAAATALKLAVFPLLVGAAARALALDPNAAAVAILFAALPGATSAYILARQMGSNHRLTAAILTVETLVSLVTLPLALLWARGG